MRIILLIIVFLSGVPVHGQESVIWNDYESARLNGSEPFLPDFSYAGYRYSEVPIPRVSHPVFDVTDYGAVANDSLSDKDAILMAVEAACSNGAGIVFFPKGKYFINTDEDNDEIILITSSNVVFRGEGRGNDGSILFFENDLPPADPEKLWTCPYAIKTKASGGDPKISDVVNDAARETFEIELADASALKAGDWVSLRMQNNDPELIGRDLAPKTAQQQWTSLLENGVLVRERHQVKEVNGNIIRFYDPIHYDVKVEYRWEVYRFAHLKEVGFEDLAFEGNWLTPFVHHQNAQHDGGWSILSLDRTVNSWVRNCRFENTNRPATFNNSAFGTALDIEITGNIGHSAISINAGSGILLAHVEDRAGMWHACGVAGGSSTGNVIWRCKYPEWTSFESHASQPRCTLLDKVSGGFFAGRAGGAISNLPNHLRYLVLWNYEETDEGEDGFRFWSQTSSYWKIVPPVVVGFHGSGTTFHAEDIAYEESTGIPVHPASLFEAQLRLRLGKLPAWIHEYIPGMKQPAGKREVPFSKGVNLSRWFQEASPGSIQFTRFTRKDLENIQSLGCDVIRLPLNLHQMTNGAPDYTLNPMFLSFLDTVVGWAEETGLHLILDNHSSSSLKNRTSEMEIILKKVWKQMALHYQDGYENLYYEVLNEPHDVSEYLWGQIQQGVINTIRSVDSTHTIIVGSASKNGYWTLDEMPYYTDTNLIYTYHFYEPFLFTHQGASWSDPSLEPLAMLPFPYHADSMPGLPPELVGTTHAERYNNYHSDGTLSKLKKRLDVALEFSRERNVPIYCGEFGVYIPNSNPSDRRTWYREVCKYLSDSGIAWTMWDYEGGFGLFKENSDAMFEHDLDTALLAAIGFNIPPQEELLIIPDSTGFILYDDHLANGMRSSSWGKSTVNYYSREMPNNGQYCIRWKDLYKSAYGTDFRPDRDLSYLADQHFALDLMVRGHDPSTAFQIRFVDTRTGPDDRPWRMAKNYSSAQVPMDGRWYRLRIPLSSFNDVGSWDDGKWHPSEGKFDWTAVDRFEIAVEKTGLETASLWCDNIHITDADTSGIHQSGIYSDTTAHFHIEVNSYHSIHYDSTLLSEYFITEPDSIGVREMLLIQDSIIRTDSIFHLDTVTFFNEWTYSDTVSHFDTLRKTRNVLRYELLTRARAEIIIKENDLGGKLNVRPNPFDRMLFISGYGQGPLSLVLSDLSGRMILRRSFTGELSLDSSGLQHGVYIMSICDPEGTSVRYRLLKE